MKWVNRLYIIFVGLILAVTTGYGVAAFYPEPRSPQYPSGRTYPSIPRSCYDTPESQDSQECKKYFEEEKQYQEEERKRNEQYQKEFEAFQNKNSAYTRTAVFFGISAGTVFALLGLLMLRLSKLVSNGLLFAGVLTAVFTRVLVGFASLGSQVTGTQGPDQMSYIQFAILTVLSLLVLLVGKFTLKDEA